ncbi:ribonuclease P protein component [Marichromatium bheemlicum]|uniref:Ribonuclease P protein component n=1 Tax=Marichromatium bheemlicum TaxID=365339 RepID=A0ABX1IAN7_9GAMM|nr:ribonuclease P protein component [Marichromatium bheemlicum]NKN34109.1 ribonuclease P protein component [Marichromatium bheemlicum]
MNPERSAGRAERAFPRERRLTCATQYRHVFSDPTRAGKQGFVVLFRANGNGYARLGLAISKKCARRAVDRNRLKRLVRESFRNHHHTLPGVDVVVMCARGAPTLPNRRLFDHLERAWATIRKKQPCAES